jgi:mRNA-degrading endonuclease RelE of RelBE toxin-antitoxin system
VSAFKIIYSDPAKEDLDALPAKFAAQIVKKIGRLENGLHGDIKQLRGHDVTYRLRMGDFRILFDVTGDAIIVQRIKDRKEGRKRMTKAILENVDAEIKNRRQQVAQMHEELEDLEDYLDVLEARRKSLGKKTYTQAEMEERYAAK